ncbi:MAG TPA: family 43 glycosylhydrolase [Cyclobacteriaceae bacterium]
MKCYLILFFTLIFHPSEAQQTYCNPIDIDYSYMSHYRALRDVSYRSGADPAVINFKGRYYMFVTRSHGYWASDDMSQWQFIKPQSWYFKGSNAPAAAVRGDKVIVYGDPSGRGTIIETDNPVPGDWKTQYAVLNVPQGIQDPNLFVDDDGKVYLYEESSNKWPIRVVQLDPDNFYVPIGEQKDLFVLEPEKHGWERFGQNHNSNMKPYLEGPWMTRHDSTYYLEYSAPGTQWNVYADGVYTANSPFGPFEYAPYNPVSYKPGGYVTGAGHGSTVRDNKGNYWHFATMAISVNYKFERRIGMFPTGFESDGQMYVNTAYGDYPHYLPDVGVDEHKNRFTEWMLLSKDKPVESSGFVEGVKQKVVDEHDSGYMLAQEAPDHRPEMVVDENVRTLWVSENIKGAFLKVDLEQVMTIHALQVNFHDFNAQIFGRPDTIRQQFLIETSTDGQNWETIIDFSENSQDRPHAYIELPDPVQARYVKFINEYFPNQFLAISDFRIFGNGNGKAPKTPKGFLVERQNDERNADVTWKTVKEAMGYVLYWGIQSDRLNNSAMIYDQNEYELRALNVGQKYFYALEAFNGNGVSERTKIIGGF